jgi:hypothetical protein
MILLSLLSRLLRINPTKNKQILLRTHLSYVNLWIIENIFFEMILLSLLNQLLRINSIKGLFLPCQSIDNKITIKIYILKIYFLK